MHFLYELADGFNYLASKPDVENDEDGGWHTSPHVRAFYRRAGRVCGAAAITLDRLAMWRFRAWHTVMRGIRGARAVTIR